MSHQCRPVTNSATVKRIEISAGLCEGHIGGNRHRLLAHRGDTERRQKTAWSANDHITGRLARIAVAVLTVAPSFVFFPPCARAESGNAQVTVEVVKAYGEWWDSTGTIYSVVLSTVITERTHLAGGETDTVTVGQITYLEHDFVTGDSYLGVGPVPRAATIRGNLASASYRATIPLAQYDPGTATYVGIGTVAVAVHLNGEGPIATSKGSNTSTDASNATVRESFAGSTRNAVPTFAIDGAEMDPSLAEDLLGYISESRTQYKSTVRR